MRKIAELANLSISEFCSAIKYDALAKYYPMTNKGRLHHGLIYTFKGTENYHFHDCTINASPGTIAYLPKGRRYKITLDGDESSVIMLDFELATEVDIPPFVIPMGKNNAVEAMFLKAENEWKNKKTACKAACLALTYNVMSTAARLEEKFIHPDKYEKIRTATEYLHAHYTEQDFRIEALAAISGINPAYFVRLFTDKFGLSPKEYVTQLKLRRARELLSQEKYTVAEIGNLLGYSDVYHFSKSFKKGVGISPAQWRKSSESFEAE